MQTPLQLSIWLQSNKQSIIAENNIKQKNLDPFFANISKAIFPTSDSFLLIMSHLDFVMLVKLAMLFDCMLI